LAGPDERKCQGPYADHYRKKKRFKKRVNDKISDWSAIRHTAPLVIVSGDWIGKKTRA